MCHFNHGVLFSIDRMTSGDDTCLATIWICSRRLINLCCRCASAASTMPDFSRAWPELLDANSSNGRRRHAFVGRILRNGSSDRTGRCHVRHSPPTSSQHTQGCRHTCRYCEGTERANGFENLRGRRQTTLPRACGFAETPHFAPKLKSRATNRFAKVERLAIQAYPASRSRRPQVLRAAVVESFSNR